jgi:hypothetical protein
MQNQLAWQIATDPSIKKRDLKLAETLANRANEGNKGKDPGILIPLRVSSHARPQRRSHRSAVGRDLAEGGMKQLENPRKLQARQCAIDVTLINLSRTATIAFSAGFSIAHIACNHRRFVVIFPGIGDVPKVGEESS